MTHARKIIVTALTIGLTVALAACGGNETVISDKPVGKPPGTTEKHAPRKSTQDDPGRIPEKVTPHKLTPATDGDGEDGAAPAGDNSEGE